MELYKKHRPKEIADMIGNESMLKALEAKLNGDTHSFLLTGPSGCGKTTLARIVADKLGCNMQHDYYEMDSASYRGIDDIRNIRKNMLMGSLTGGGCRVWLLDECFAKGTMVSTPMGDIPIENIKPKQTVHNINGVDVAKRLFKNKVQLDRVIKLSLSNGQIIYTTKQHEFLTDEGWVEAQYLNNGFTIFSELGYNMQDINIPKELNNDNKNMPTMRGIVPNKKLGKKEDMLKSMWAKIKTKEIRKWFIGNQIMQVLRETTNGTCIFHKTILQSIMPWQMENATAGICKKDTQSRRIKKDIRRTIPIPKAESKAGEGIKYTIIKKNDKEQPNAYAGHYGQNAKYKTDQRNTPCMERNAWWERAFNRTANTFSPITWVGNGIRRFFGQTKKRVSDMLQNRYSKSGIQNRNRGRWERPQGEKGYIARCKKRKDAKSIRVENIEIYQRGNNERSFLGIIGNKEINQGFVEFYDLQIQGHPSYYANGIPVHNCHQLSKDAQTALLKALEDTPRHVYFILATTDPQKLLPTIKTRCTTFKVDALTDKELAGLIKQVSRQERKKIPERVVDMIIDNSLGSARMALVLLDKVIDLSEGDMLAAVEQAAADENEVIELCRALMAKKGWSTISKILRSIEQEPEGIRRMVRGYFAAALIKGDNAQASFIIDNFYDLFYDKACLVNACYLCSK